MLFPILSTGKPWEIILNILLTLPVIVCAITLHEAAHAYASFRLNDPTAKRCGRLTLNPLKHIDPIGCVWMLIFGFGWGKPIPIKPERFRDPQKGISLTALAGVGANLSLGLVGCLLHAVFSYIYYTNFSFSGHGEILSIPMYAVTMLFYYTAVMNFTLVFYNLIPIPPFDGSKFFALILPQKAYAALKKYEGITLIIVFALTFLLWRFLGYSPVARLAHLTNEIVSTPIKSLLSACFS